MRRFFTKKRQKRPPVHLFAVNRRVNFYRLFQNRGEGEGGNVDPAILNKFKRHKGESCNKRQYRQEHREPRAQILSPEPFANRKVKRKGKEYEHRDKDGRENI